ncbi:bifunctional transcriptional activator/DNA repair enzyme AdaA [Clostridium sp. UBA3887]|uniref:bifunctional transcriptional activator/DNA repair enzyme AdaA n=1 Tax=Clostridium sp. UBA3887 TaxID=1946356 RepID=UPI003216D266
MVVIQGNIVISEDEKWNAVISCNKYYDGLFYYAVKTTGICCRPSCKAKTPLKENILFFNSVDDAIKAGFRPCKLCRPDIKEHNFEPNRELIEKVKEKLIQNYNKPINFRFISKEFGVSISHLTRLFKEYTGLTPNEYVSQIRINKAMQLLSKSNDTILEIAYDVGFKSLSNFYKCFKQHAGIAPKEYRKRNSINEIKV